MSAYLVSKAHIDLLVDLALRGPRDMDKPGEWEPTETDPDQLGKMLWEQNERSVLNRYPRRESDEATKDAITNYKFVPPPYHLNLAEAVKAIHCLQYQSSESEDYEIAPAGQWANEMLQVLSYYVPGYEAAPLHWDETVLQQ